MAGRCGLRHEPGLLRTGQIALYGGKAAFKHGKAALAAAGLVEQRGHVFTDGKAGIEGKLYRPAGPVQRNGGVLFLRRKTVKLRLEQAGRVLCRNHAAEPFLFVLQLVQQLAQAVGFGLMRLGGFSAREGCDAAQDLRFPGCRARTDGILDHQFLAGRAVGVAAAFGRQGPCGKLALPIGILIKEKIPASGLQIEEQGGLFVRGEQGEGAAQGRRDDRPVPPALALTGFGPARGIGPCRSFRLRRRVETQRGPFPQI